MKPPRSIASFRLDTARRLRKNATFAEIKLWRHLRQVPMLGSHFRRQVPVGPYVADFACMASKLLIEVDGTNNIDGVMEVIYAAVHGAANAEPEYLKHDRRRVSPPDGAHPTPAPFGPKPMLRIGVKRDGGRRPPMPSPSRGG